MENDVTQRFREFMKSTGLAISAFADTIGIPPSTLNQQLNGRKGKNIGIQISAITAVLATYPDLSAEWLLRGDGSIEKGAKAVQVQFGNVLNNTLMQTIDSLNTTIAMLKERLQAYEQPKKVSDAV